jgi:ABC-type Na+ efflux pump permease subunit
MLVIFVLGTFGIGFYSSGGTLTHWKITQGVNQAAGWCGLVHFAVFAPIVIRGAWSIAKERERRTLEFLLATPMTNGEIVLGKLASCLVMVFAMLAAGFPLILLLHVVGGIDLRLIAVCYAAVVSSALFLSTMAIWISAEAPNLRWASAAWVLGTMAWCIGPFSLAVFLPRFGIRLPGWLATTNAWLIFSSPITVAFHLATGFSSWTALCYIIGRMIALQLVGAALLTIGATARLRTAQRAFGSGDQGVRSPQILRPVRLPRRPLVGDDPILWREINTTRSTGLMKATGVFVSLGLVAALAYPTYYFARLAILEVWRHGYPSGITTDARPELNLLVRMFVPGGVTNEPVDAARTDFNLFLRYVTVSITFFLTFVGGIIAAEVVSLERRKDTWDSLLATPMSARAILKSLCTATVWRVRLPIGMLSVLWTIGLIAGAIHPLGYLSAMLNLAALVWLFAAWGVWVSIRARDQSTADAQTLNLGFLTLLFLALPFLLPARFNSVLLGAGSQIFVGWISLVSYRDVRAAFHYRAYPPLEWVGIGTGEGAVWVIASWVLGIAAPAIAGWWMWRSANAHFDRLVGRPWRTPADSRQTPMSDDGVYDPSLPTRRRRAI